MTSIQRKRLHAELDRAAYRARVARQIGILLALAFVCLCVSCVSRYAPPTEPAEESRKALPAVVVKTRRTNGTFDTPDTSPWSLPIARKRWEFADSGGNLCVSEWMTIKAPPKPVAPVATEFPKLSEP